jgi:vacuolar-type H+-ATPase subunit I/STV1
MAKKILKKTTKKSASQNAALASLLVQLQARVTNLTNETNAALAGIQSQVDRAWELQNSREGVASKNRTEIEKFSKNTTDSMYALRDSTQKAFTNVATDIQSAKNTLQRLNERISIVESRLSEVETRAKVSEDFRLLLTQTFKNLWTVAAS